MAFLRPKILHKISNQKIKNCRKVKETKDRKGREERERKSENVRSKL